MLYKLIKDFDVGSICFRAGTEFVFYCRVGTYVRLLFSRSDMAYHGCIRIPDTKFLAYFREV